MEERERQVGRGSEGQTTTLDLYYLRLWCDKDNGNNSAGDLEMICIPHSSLEHQPVCVRV